jgi:N-acetylglucosaminyldiphosphoundecaprenol N-acetyl-beta-D-mannosaminyltransferase
MTQTAPAQPATVAAFGFQVNPGTIDEYLNFTASTIAGRGRVSLFDHNLHSLYAYFRYPHLRRLYQDATVMVDGMPVIAMLQLAGCAVERRHRVTWVDYIWPLLERAETAGWRVFYVGSDPVTCERALTRIRERLPRLEIAGRHGYFDTRPGSAANADVVGAINLFETDLCLVGMGTPLQQEWIGEHRAGVRAPVMVFCGGCMEFVAGTAPTPPRWLGPLGLEWSYRLLSDPRRFARRYLVEPWVLLAMMLTYRLRPQHAANRRSGLR